jgi:hypothetical protein
VLINRLDAAVVARGKVRGMVAAHGRARTRAAGRNMVRAERRDETIERVSWARSMGGAVAGRQAVRLN